MVVLASIVVMATLYRHGIDDSALVVPVAVEHDDDDDDGKAPVYEILVQAGVKKSDLNDATKHALPTWAQIQNLYGKHPVIQGLDRCDDFVQNIDPSMAFMGAAGTFNTGTNLLAELLARNCEIAAHQKRFGKKQRGIQWQVPWGKHTPVKYRGKHVIEPSRDVPVDNILPMVTIRDPYRWMTSMCRQRYTVRWGHKADNCPHLFSEKTNKPTGAQVRYGAASMEHPSLPALYNDYYNTYLNSTFPRVVVRMEDLVFYGENVTRTICACGGGRPRVKTFQHVFDSAKTRTAENVPNQTGLVGAIIRYGKDDRAKGVSASDLEWARKLFDPTLLDMFHYHHPEMTVDRGT